MFKKSSLALDELTFRKGLYRGGKERVKSALCARSRFQVRIWDFKFADRFKEINDRWGHAFGDYVLKKVASLLGTSLHTSDILGRFGGDEFIVGLVETNPEAVDRVAERLRLKCNWATFNLDEASVGVTLNIGLETLSPGVDELGALTAKAD